MLVCIIGMSASGKDTLANEICKYDRNIHLCVSHTTRPMRLNEVDGESYYFVTNDEFLQMKEDNLFLEDRTYKVANGELWRYGLSLQELHKHKNSIAIVDLNGYIEIKNKFKSQDIYSVYLNANDDIRYSRYLKRLGEYPNKDELAELKRRITQDTLDMPISKVLDSVDIVLASNTDSDLEFNKYIINKIFMWRGRGLW